VETAPLRVVHGAEILNRLEEEIDRAGRYGRPLTVVCVAPQLLAGQTIPSQEMTGAATSVTDQLRFCDVVGTFQAGSMTAILAILPEASQDDARPIAHRLATDLVRRSAGNQQRNWRSGIASVPQDGTDVSSIVQIAYTRAAR
jgi:hypothetical protein